MLHWRKVCCIFVYSFSPPSIFLFFLISIYWPVMKKILYNATLVALLIMPVKKALGEKLDFYGRDAATVGVYITDLASGKSVESENINKSMIPASILKSVTSASALNILGMDFRYVTEVALQGEVKGAVLHGNLLVKASGDPTVESSYFTDRTGFIDMIVAQLKERGISTVTGQIIVDEDMFTDTGQIPQWVIEDTGWDYGAGYYGFNYSNNTFRLYPGDMTTVPEVADIDVVVEKNNSGTDILRGINSDIYIVIGRNVDKPKFYVTTTMNDPAYTFVCNLTKRLQREGIRVEDNVVDDASGVTSLLKYESPVNTEMLRTMMFRSDNMMAEATLRALAPGQSRDAAIKKELAFWKNNGVSTDFIKIADGSGLARVDRVTPRFITQVLTFMAKSRHADTYVSLFPKAGREGTVKSFLKHTALDGKLVLKSGSMNGVHCYAGYRIDKNGKPTHTIVIIVNNFFCSRDALRKEIQRFLLAVFK